MNDVDSARGYCCCYGCCCYFCLLCLLADGVGLKMSLKQAYNVYRMMANTELDWAVDNVMKNVQNVGFASQRLHKGITKGITFTLEDEFFFHLCQTINENFHMHSSEWLSSFPLTWLNDFLPFASSKPRTLYIQMSFHGN